MLCGLVCFRWRQSLTPLQRCHILGQSRSELQLWERLVWFTRGHTKQVPVFVSLLTMKFKWRQRQQFLTVFAPFVRTSVRAAYGDSWTEHQDFSRTKLLWVEVGAGLCCHGFWYALVPGRGGGSAGGIRQGQHSTVGVSTSFSVNYIRLFVARFSTWTRAWLRSSQPSTSALWCSVKTCLSSVYRASCIEATLYDPRIPAYRILLYLEFRLKYKIELSFPVALNNSEYQSCKFWIVFHVSAIKNGSLFSPVWWGMAVGCSHSAEGDAYPPHCGHGHQGRTT